MKIYETLMKHRRALSHPRDILMVIFFWKSTSASASSSTVVCYNINPKSLPTRPLLDFSFESQKFLSVGYEAKSRSSGE